MNSKLNAIAIGVTIGVLAAGCSRDSDEEVAQTAPPPAAATTDENPLQAEMWIDDVELTHAGATGVAAAGANGEFAPGDAIQITMNVDDAPPATMVTVQWVGPTGPLGYEIKEVPADQQTLDFTQENTFDWVGGEYRAEVWVGDEKVDEQSFEVSAG